MNGGSGGSGSNEVLYLRLSFWLFNDFLGSSLRAIFWDYNTQDGLLPTSLVFQLGWLDQVGAGQSSLSLALYMASSCWYLGHLHHMEVSGQLDFLHGNWLPASIPTDYKDSKNLVLEVTQRQFYCIILITQISPGAM